MKTAWAVLIISALTDFILTFATGLTTAMSVSDLVGMPNYPTILLAALGGIAVAMRTIQQALKATTESTAALKGETKP